MLPAHDGTVSMGDLIAKTVEVSATYRECRAAALASPP